jgi:LmbE family N-acetylglucosaminyl deacetylase
LKILIIAAHPDDDVLGMGGTILKHSKLGDLVRIIYLATGITSRRNPGHKNSPQYEINEKQKKLLVKEIENLRKNAEKARKLLKVDSINFFDFPDNEMDTVSLLKIVKTIENEIRKFQPEKIYTNHRSDLNIDHRVTFQATLTACRPGTNKVKEIISFEVPSSTEWNYPTSFTPNYFVDITKELEKKLKAMEAYEHESKSFPHPRSNKSLRSIAYRWGSVSGTHAAEAFEIIRKINT